MSPAYYWHGDKRKAVDVASRRNSSRARSTTMPCWPRPCWTTRSRCPTSCTTRTPRTGWSRGGPARGTTERHLAPDPGAGRTGTAGRRRRPHRRRHRTGRARGRPGARRQDPDALAMALREQARQLAASATMRAEQALRSTDELIALARPRGIPAQLARARLSEYAIAARAGRARRAEAALVAAVDMLQTLHAKERLARAAGEPGGPVHPGQALRRSGTGQRRGAAHRARARRRARHPAGARSKRA